MSKSLPRLLCAVLLYAVARSTKPPDINNAKKDSIPAVLEIPNEEDGPRRRTMEELAPDCGEFLQNVLVGRWVGKAPPYNVSRQQRKAIQLDMKNKEKRLDQVMRSVWRKRGIPLDPWKSTTYCGYYRLRGSKESGKRARIGTWCDPNGPRPCCNNLLRGYCVRARKGECSCPKCADVRNLRHAELMDWLPYTYWCKWRQYNPSEACDVIESSPAQELYFVGDSFLQSMYLSLLMILTGKPVTGMWRKGTLTADERAKCSNYGLTYFKACRAMTESLDDMLYKDALCGGGRNVTFKAEFKRYYSSKFVAQFRQLVKGLAGKKGTYVIVGIGFHVQFDLRLALWHFLNPALREVDKYYIKQPQVPRNKRWPRFLFSLAMDYGLLKPTGQLKAHYTTKQQTFERGMKNYCKMNSIQVLDFTPLTKNVHTFDGIHYGVAVNNMKTQIFLNWLASLAPE